MDPVDLDAPTEDAPSGAEPLASPSGTPVLDLAPMPEFSTAPSADAPGHRPSHVDVPRQLPAAPIRVVGLGAAALALFLVGWQAARVINDDVRSSTIAWLSLLAAAVATVGVLAWTWTVVENVRRLVEPARTQEPPRPWFAVSTWIPVVAFVAVAAGVITVMAARINDPGDDTSSSVPILMALITFIVALLLMYRPLAYLSGAIRRIGGSGIDLPRLVWVPLAFVVVGGASLLALRIGGAYEDDVDGIPPMWALGVVAIPPILIVLASAWRGAASAEDAVDFAFDRRRGVHSAGVGRGRLGFFTRALRADTKPAIARDVRKKIRLVPGADPLRLVLVSLIAALALVSIVGALVMFLFWREASDSVLLQGQRDRAWDVLNRLQSLERSLAYGVLAITSIWAFVSVLNARLASGRRRNPLLAALAWPAAGVGIWMIADRVADEDTAASVVIGLAVQAAVLYVPFFLLERAAVTVGARRDPIRITYGLGVVLLVHIQGLGGLSTISEVSDTERFGRLAGYLALGALVQLVSTLAVTEASHLISDAAQAEADRHNFLADQRKLADDTTTSDSNGATAPSVADVGPAAGAPTSSVVIAATTASPSGDATA